MKECNKPGCSHLKDENGNCLRDRSGNKFIYKCAHPQCNVRTYNRGLCYFHYSEEYKDEFEQMLHKKKISEDETKNKLKIVNEPTGGGHKASEWKGLLRMGKRLTNAQKERAMNNNYIGDVVTLPGRLFR